MCLTYIQRLEEEHVTFSRAHLGLTSLGTNYKHRNWNKTKRKNIYLHTYLHTYFLPSLLLTYLLTNIRTYILIDYFLTYLITLCSRVLLEKLIGSQLVKKFPAFYGTWKFISEFTSACHLPLSWTRSIQSVPPHPSSWRSILILSSHLRLDLPSGLLPSAYPTKILYMPCSPHTCYMHLPSYSSRFDHPGICYGVQNVKVSK